MVAAVVEDEAWSAVAALTFAVDALVGTSLTSLPARELPVLARAVEEQLRRLPVAATLLGGEWTHRAIS